MMPCLGPVVVLATFRFFGPLQSHSVPPSPHPELEVQRLIDNALRLPPQAQLRPLQDALTLAEKLRDIDGQSISLRRIGNLFLLSEPDRAVPLYERALSLAKKVKDQPCEVACLYNLGSASASLHRLDQALKLLAQSLSLAQTLGDKTLEGFSLWRIGDVYRERQGGLVKAEDYFVRAIDIFKAIGRMHEEAETRMSLGAAYRDMDQVSKSFEQYSIAVDLQGKLGDEERRASALQGLGYAELKLNDYSASLASLTEAAAIEKSHRDWALQAWILNDLALTYGALGESRKARECLTEALPLWDKVPDPTHKAWTLNNLGINEFRAGDYGAGLKSLLAALEIEIGHKDQRAQGWTLDNIGLLYLAAGQARVAKTYMDRALPLLQKANDLDSVTNVTESIGDFYFGRQSYSDASKCYERALTIARSRKDRNVVSEAHLLGAIGCVYMETGKLEQASDNLEKALSIEQKAGDRHGEAGSLGDIARCYAKKGDFSKALDLFGQALTIESEIGNRVGQVRVLSSTGDVFEALNLIESAITEYKLSVNTMQSVRANSKTLPRDLQDSMKRSYEQIYRGLAGLLIRKGRLAEAEEVMNLLKDDEYFKFLRSAKAEQVDLTPIESRWVAQYAELGGNLAKDEAELRALSALKQHDDRQITRMAELEKKLAAGRKAFQTFLLSAKSYFANLGAEQNRLSDLDSYKDLADIVNHLPGRPAAVYTLVTADGVRSILTLPNLTELKTGPEGKVPFAELAKKIARLRTALNDPGLDPIQPASELYDLLIRPLENDLQAAGVKSLMFSLDGPLRYLPVAALYDRNTHEWLCQKYPLSLFTPAVRSKMKDTPPSVVVAAGFGVTQAHAVNNVQFAGLTAVDAELSSLRRSYGARIFEDDRFTEESFKRELFNHDTLVHLATHFELKPGDASNSYLLLGDGTPLSISDFASWTQEKLGGIDLFVVSACNTGTAVDDGGEYESFARAAQENGAAAVMATLWPVNDTSTALFMSKFYELRSHDKTITKTEALRQTQMWLMKCTDTDLKGIKRARPATHTKDTMGLGRYKTDPKHPFAHPFYWAPFVLTGNVK